MTLTFFLSYLPVCFFDFILIAFWFNCSCEVETRFKTYTYWEEIQVEINQERIDCFNKDDPLTWNC